MIFYGLLFLLVRPLGAYMERVYAGQRTWPTPTATRTATPTPTPTPPGFVPKWLYLPVLVR